MNWKTVIAIRQQGYAGVPPAAAASETLYPPSETLAYHQQAASETLAYQAQAKLSSHLLPLTTHHSPLKKPLPSKKTPS